MALDTASRLLGFWPLFCLGRLQSRALACRRARLSRVSVSIPSLFRGAVAHHMLQGSLHRRRDSSTSWLLFADDGSIWQWDQTKTAVGLWAHIFTSLTLTRLKIQCSRARDVHDHDLRGCPKLACGRSYAKRPRAGLEGLPRNFTIVFVRGNLGLRKKLCRQFFLMCGG